MFAASQSSLIGASASLLQDLGATPAQYAWALSGNLVATAVVTPLAGRLGDLVGNTRVFLGSVVVAVLGGVLAVVVPGIGAVVAARVLQGAGGGMLPLAVGIARQLWPDRLERGSWLATCVSIGGAVGPAIGGVLSELGGYRNVFLTISTALAVSEGAVAATVPRSAASAPGRLDVLGVLLLSVLVVCPLLVLSQGGSWGWRSPQIGVVAALGVAALGAFVWHERRVAAPLISLDALRGRAVVLTSVATVAVGAVSYAALVMSVQLAQASPSVGGLGAGPTVAGLLLVPGSAAIAVCAAAGARITRLPDGAVMAAGGVLAVTGLVVFATTGGPITFVAGSVMASAGVGATFAPLSTFADASAADGRTAEAQGVNTLLRIVGSAIGGQVSIALLTASAVDTGEPRFGPAWLVFACVAALVVVAGVTLAARRPGCGGQASATDDS